jgi:hypothetical protein
MADVLLTLNNDQIKDLFVHLEDENREMQDEINSTTPEEKLEKSKDKLISNFSDWLGPLNDTQKDILRAWPAKFKPLDEDRMAFRKKWQQALIRVLLGNASKEQKRKQLLALITKPDEYQTEEHKAKLAYNSKQVKELMLTFDHTVTAEQKQFLAERLDKFITAFQELIAEGKQQES